MAAMTPLTRSGRCGIPAWHHDCSPPAQHACESTLVNSWYSCAAHHSSRRGSLRCRASSSESMLALDAGAASDSAACVICRQQCRGTTCQTFQCPPPAAGIASAAPTAAACLASMDSMRPGTLSMTATPPSPASCQRVTCLTAMGVRRLALFICRRQRIYGARLDRWANLLKGVELVTDKDVMHMPEDMSPCYCQCRALSCVVLASY